LYGTLDVSLRYLKKYMAQLHKLERDEELEAAIESAFKALNSGNKKYLTRCSKEHVIYIYEYICSLAVNIFEEGDGFALPNLGVWKVKLKTVEGRTKQFGEDKLWFKNGKSKRTWKHREKRLPETADAHATLNTVESTGADSPVKRNTFNIKKSI
jgi:hypothetical protein